MIMMGMVFFFIVLFSIFSTLISRISELREWFLKFVSFVNWRNLRFGLHTGINPRATVPKPRWG